MKAIDLTAWRCGTIRAGWMLLALLLPALLGTAGAQETVSDSLAAAVAQSPRDGDAWVRLGQARLDAGDLDRAEKAFRKAMRCGRKAEGYNGLGLVLLKREGGAQEALVHFRKARGAKRGFVEAQMNIARTYILLENLNAEQALKRAIAMDSTYALAHLMLVAFREELEAYEATPEEEREAFLAAFWRRRDLTLVSDGRARRAEHYPEVRQGRRLSISEGRSGEADSRRDQ